MSSVGTIAVAQALEAPSGFEANAELEGIHTLHLSTGTQVFLRFSRQVEYRRGILDQPARLYYDFYQAQMAAGLGSEFSVDSPLLRQVRVGVPRPGILRIVFDLADSIAVDPVELSEPPQMLLELRSAPGDSIPAESAKPAEGQPTDRSQPTETRRGARPPPAPAGPGVSSPSQPAVPVELPRIYRVEATTLPDLTKVFVGVQRSVEFRRSRLNKPDRLVFELEGTRLSPSVPESLQVQDTRLVALQLSRHSSTVVRLVLELEPGILHRVEFQKSPPGLLVELVGGSPPGPEPTPAPAGPSVPPGPISLPDRLGELQPPFEGVPKEGPPVLPPPTLPPVQPVSTPPQGTPSPAVSPAPQTSTKTATPVESALPSRVTPDRRLPPVVSEVRETPTVEEPHSRDLSVPAAVIVPKVSNPPTLDEFLDGRPREAEAVVTGFRQRTPGDGTPVSEETTAYLSYDDRNLYAVFVCKDDPSQIRSRMTKREQIDRDDVVSVYLDTFRDYRRAYVFQANPYGIQRDGILAEGQSIDFKFDTLWSSRGQMTRDGFVVWMAIPFKSLRFARSDAQTWGIALGRSIRRREETSLWPFVSRRIDGFVQQMAEMQGLSSVSPGRNVEVIPYSTYTDSRFLDSLPEGGLGYIDDDEFRAGVDAKTVIRDSLTLDLTVNPDFSQVESDEPQVTINQRFEVFFPEKRPFFLENADFFQTPERLFFSRRIIDPQYGARLSGKLGDWRMGFLAMDDRAPGTDLAETDPNSGKRAANAVVRFQRDLGDQSNAGVLITSRDFAGTYNRVFAFDTRLKIDPNWFFTGQMAASQTKRADASRIEDPALQVQLTHSGTHANFFARYLDRAPDFRSALGFIQRVDIRQTDAYYQYLWYPEGSKLLDFGPSFSGLANWDRLGRLQDWYFNGNFRIDLLGPTNVEVNHFEAYTFYDNLDFRYGRTDASIYTGFLNWLEIFASYGQGTDINYIPPIGVPPYPASSRQASLFLGVRPISQLSMDTTYLYSALRTLEDQIAGGTPESVSIFNNHLVRFRTNFQFNRELSLRAILDYNSVLPNGDLIALERDKFLTFDILLTYLLNPGTAVYLGYTNRYWNIELDETEPFGYRRINTPTTPTSRQFFVKLSKLFRF